MTGQDPTPQTTLVILLGASEWPDSPDFPGSKAFANVAGNFRAYLLNPQHFGLPEENFLDLFDTEHGPEKIDQAIRQFLDQRTLALQQAGKPPRTCSSTSSAMVDFGGGTPNTTSLCAAPRVTGHTFPAYGWNRLPRPSQTRQDTCGVSSSWIVVMRLLLLPRFKQRDPHKWLFGKPSMCSRRRRKGLAREPRCCVLRGKR